MEYQHGGDIYSQEVDLDFSANLNPFGLPEAVRRAAADSLGDCTVYPDSSSRKLTAALAAYHGVPQEQVICGYHTMIDWDKTGTEKVTALIEVRVTPQRGQGFDSIAERIYNYPEVKSVYLISGGYDLMVILEGKTLREVSSFVSDKLSTLEAVLSTATHFILKKYKEKHLVFRPQDPEEREYIFT